jgi:hypothetical protein
VTFCSGTSAAGVPVAADATPTPPANENNPAAPKTGTAFVLRFRFEARFDCDMAETSHIFRAPSTNRHRMIVTLALVAGKGSCVKKLD